MDLSYAILAILLKHCPPGNTAFSVEPATAGQYSSFYGSTVVRESAEHGRARYEIIATALADAASDVLKGEKPPGAKLWRERELAAFAVAVAIPESGMREDVQTGRGRAKQADDVGGRGRGPSGEACFMQVHPAVFGTFARGGSDSLLGLEPEKVRECFRAGMRMLVRARAFCAARPEAKWSGYDWLWATAAMYGTGSSCVASNHGKTAIRANLAGKLIRELRKREPPTLALMGAGR